MTKRATSFCPSAQARSLRTLEAEALRECSPGPRRPDASLRVEPSFGRTRLDRGDCRGARFGAAGNLRLRDPMRRRSWPRTWPRSCPDAGKRGCRASITSPAPNGSIRTALFARWRRSSILPPPRALSLAPAEAAGAAFGQGETSLRTQAVHRAVGLPMPMLVEGLQRLLEQKNGGFDRCFRGSRRLATSKVA